MSRSEISTLRTLAQWYAIEPEHRDGCAQLVTPSPETLIGVLRALGCDIDRVDQAADALARRRLEVLRDVTPPVLVAWDGAPIALPIRMEESAPPGVVSIRIEMESGDERIIEANLSDFPVMAREEAEGIAFVTRTIPLGDRFPLGEHALFLRLDGQEHRTTVISAPAKAYQGDATEKEWGIFAPLYALRRTGDGGVGDISHLRAMGDWAAGRGASLVSTLPLNAMFLDEPCVPSPYSPITRLFWSEIYIDLSQARQTLDVDEDETSLGPEIEPPLIDYHEVMRTKRRALEPLAEAAWRHAERRREFLSELTKRPELDLFARFRAEVERHSADWRSWKCSIEPDSVDDRAAHDAAWRYHVFCQCELIRQLGSLRSALEEKGVSLYLDLPLGAHPDGFDAWRRQSLFANGATVGAPPDALFSGGQNWGFAPVDPRQGRLSGHAYFRDALRAPLEFANVLRIDHAPCMHRLYWIPEGAGARDGAYVHYPAEEQYAMLNLESHRAKARIIGENLGAVPDYVTKELSRRGAMTMCVAQLEFESDEPPLLKAPTDSSLVSLNTHDTATFAGFWSGADIEDRKSLGLLDALQLSRQRARRADLKAEIVQWLGAQLARQSVPPTTEQVFEALLRRLADTDGRTLLVSLEDLWLEPRPQNVPGTSFERPNWRRRCAETIDDIVSDPAIRRLLEEINALRRGRR